MFIVNFGVELIRIAYELGRTSRFRTSTIVIKSETSVLTSASHVSQACPDRLVVMVCLGPVAGRLGTPLFETKPAAGAVPMTKRPQSKFSPTVRAAFGFTVVMLPSWWVLLHGCEFEPSKIHLGPLHPRVTTWMSDEDGGE